ncbi:MAG: cardiolipin synthase, partial [Lachnospiraceae bacterium oral taxon 082]|nr:cardiolipin synthase [Lachnospiraceae bacterium oral taxon 082]
MFDFFRTGHIAFVHLFYINLVLSIVIVFFQRREPRAVWTWLLALNFLPVVGIILYLLIGQDYRKSKMFKIKNVEDSIRKAAIKQEKFFANNDRVLNDPYTKDYQRQMQYNLMSGGSLMTMKNTLKIFNDGNDKFDALIEDIKNAKEYIHLQYYIIKNDYLFRNISRELIKKADEGVEVRVLFDGMGGRFMSKKLLDNMKAHKIKIGVFFPAALGKINFRINYRNHRKIAVIDGKIGYVGGFNIGKEYVDGSKKFGHWRDTHLRIVGEAVNGLELRFGLDWNYATKEDIFNSDKYFKPLEEMNILPENGDDVLRMQIISSGPDSETKLIRDNYIEIINNAKDHVYIHTPYFIPDEAFMSALNVAARSGVDVRLMIPCMPDHPFVYSATLSWAGTLLEAGGKVYTYERGFLHAKSVMADGKVACVGTANMDIRSFELNFEVNAMIYDEEVTVELEDNFMRDIYDSKEYTFD